MVSKRARFSAVLVAILLAVPSLAATAQNTVSRTSPSQPDFLPAGPFFFEPGAIHPIYMDAFDTRPVVKSPDGKLGVTVTGPKESYEAWVTVDPSSFPDGPVQIWPIQRNVDVLWRPDGQAFALTDNRYANRSYVLVCGTNFRMGENGPGLGIPVTDLTPIVAKAFEKRAQRYYAGQNFDIPLSYAKVLRWVDNDQLLVGLSARTVLGNRPGSGARTLRIRDWNLGYLVDVRNKKVVDVLSEAQLLSDYRIKVAK